MKYLILVAIIVFSGFSTFSQSTTVDGIDLYREGNFDKASEVLKAITTANEKDNFAWVYYAAALLKRGHKKEAVAAFKKGKAKVEDLVLGDESPVSDFKKPRPNYTDMARKNLTVGNVKLAVELRADGKIGFISVIEALPNGLTEQSIAAARRITFTPAVKKGKPVGIVAVVEYSFAIY